MRGGERNMVTEVKKGAEAYDVTMEDLSLIHI